MKCSESLCGDGSGDSKRVQWEQPAANVAVLEPRDGVNLPRHRHESWECFNEEPLQLRHFDRGRHGLAIGTVGESIVILSVLQDDFEGVSKSFG